MHHVDEGRKRVLLIAASILAARELAQFDGGKRVPATVSAKLQRAVEKLERSSMGQLDLLQNAKETTTWLDSARSPQCQPIAVPNHNNLDRIAHPLYMPRTCITGRDHWYGMQVGKTLLQRILQERQRVNFRVASISSAPRTSPSGA